MFVSAVNLCWCAALYRFAVMPFYNSHNVSRMYKFTLDTATCKLTTEEVYIIIIFNA